MATIDKVSKIIFSTLSERTLKISPLIGKGAVNEVFKVETENAKFIVRINDENSFDEYRKELWVAERAKAKNIPVAEILKIGIFDGKAYSIQKFIEGTEGRDLAVDRSYIWKTLGKYARRIHQIKVVGFGLQFRDMVYGDAEQSWRKYLEYNIESLNETDELRNLGVLTKGESETVKEIFENLRLRKFKFGLNHGDLSLKNTIVDDSGEIHLIDWGSSEAGIVPHLELIQLLKMNMLENDPDDDALKSFLDGYGISPEEHEVMLPDLKSLLILRAFDKLRWAIDWKVTNLEDYIIQAKKTIRKYLL